MQGLDIGYFNLNLGIEEAFEAKRGDIQEKAEALKMVKFKSQGAKRTPKYGLGAAKLAIEDRRRPSPGSSQLAIEAGSAESPTTEPAAHELPDNPPPPYASTLSPELGSSGVGRANSTGSAWGAAAKAKAPAPPPPKPKPTRLSGVPPPEMVTALYDYEAQAEGDLSFSTGDEIEIVTRSDNVNEWWIGKVQGKQGQFPGWFSPLLLVFDLHGVCRRGRYLHRISMLTQLLSGNYVQLR